MDVNSTVWGCQQNLIPSSPFLDFICHEANSLSNQGIYYARQLKFKTGKLIGKYDLEAELKSSKHYQALYSQAAQQVLRSVYESFKSFSGLLKLFKTGKLEVEPNLPTYRTKGGLAVVSYPKQALKLVDQGIRIPLGTLVKTWFKVDSFIIPMPSNLSWSDIKEIRILPRNKSFYAEYVYKLPKVNNDLDSSLALGIDHGINNWLTCVSNAGTSFIIDGLGIKSINNFYNKQVATIKEGKPKSFWSNRLAFLTEKRNRQVRDAVNKAARMVIDHCLEHKIGNVVFGWNSGQKQNINLGTKTNQKFVQIPTGRLKERIKQLCERYNILFFETEESYTSRSSFLDNDTLPTFGEKPEGWQATGTRIKRGLYKAGKNLLVNADCNGAANVLRKVSTSLGLDLSGVSMGALTHPIRLKIWMTAKKSERVRLQPTL